MKQRMQNDDNIVNFIRDNIKAPNGMISELEIYAHDNYVPIAKPETAAFLKTVCAVKRPLRIFEAGTAIGYSSIIMAEFLGGEGIIDTVEINEDIADVAKKNIKKAGYENKINVIVADVGDVIKCMEKKYDMVFLDAAKGQYKELYDDAKRLLTPGGILISDNIFFDGRVAKEGKPGRKFRTIVVNMREYLNMLMKDEEYQTSLLNVGDGIAFSVKIGGKND